MRPNGAVLAHGQFRLINGGQANWLTPTAVSPNKTLPVGVIAIWSVNRPAMMKDRSPSAEHAAAQMRSNGHPLGQRGRPFGWALHKRLFSSCILSVLAGALVHRVVDAAAAPRSLTLTEIG